jgi:hypothetical protein
LGIGWAAKDAARATMVGKITSIRRLYGKANVLAMVSKDPELTAWLHDVATRGNRGDLPELALQLEHNGIDLKRVAARTASAS